MGEALRKKFAEYIAKDNVRKRRISMLVVEFGSLRYVENNELSNPCNRMIKDSVSAKQFIFLLSALCP